MSDDYTNSIYGDTDGALQYQSHNDVWLLNMYHVYLMAGTNTLLCDRFCKAMLNSLYGMNYIVHPQQKDVTQEEEEDYDDLPELVTIGCSYENREN